MKHTKHILQTIVLTVALIAAGQTALAETVTYTISGNIELTQSNLTVTASGSASGTVTDSWDITKTSECSVTLPGSISLSFGSDKTTSLGVESGTLRIQASGSTGGYITLSHDSKYIYHVTLKDDSNNVFHEAWNMEKSYTHRFQAIYVKTIVVEYADKIPITDAVISGIDNSYVVSDTPVQPVPTAVIWHGTTLTKDTHYTLSWSHSSSAGTATVNAFGKGIFSTSSSASKGYTLVWATYNVRFNKNNDSASGTMADQAFTYSTAQALTANAFTAPTGYAFAGWSTTPDGTVAYTNGQSVSNLTATDGATVDLYAQWTPITYTVRFNKNSDGATGTMADQAFTFNTAQALTANAFTRIGYIFDGWSTTANGAVAYTDGQSVSNLTATNGATVDLYAQWTRIPWEGDGSGTADDPYQISNYAELKQFANIVNGTGGEAFAKLVADIVYKNSIDDTEYATDWVPIGNASRPYTGTFDGQGYTITGLSTPNNNSSDYVGLFGYMGSQGVVKYVILEAAAITGNNHVGVIAGYNNNGTLSHNYYVSCSVNSAATNIGTGSGDCNGARSVHALSLPANVTASGESVVINSAAHYAAGTTVTLSYSGTVPDGYSVSYSYNDGTDHAIMGDTFTMPAADVTVRAQYITGVRYIDGNGIEQVCSNYTIIQSSNSRQFFGDSSNKEAWYVVAGDVTVEGGIRFDDRPALILCDGATLTVIADNENGINSQFAFTIYGQSGGTGSLSATGLRYGIRGEQSVAITGGNVSAIGSTGISSALAVTITGGNVSATGSNYGIIGKTVTISGGNVTATGDQHEGIRSSTGIYLGWTHDSDRITASSYYSAAVMVNKDQYFTDGTNIYSANLNNSQIIALKGKTLRPYLDPTGGTTITLVQGTKDGVTAWWGTFCNTNHYVLSEGAAAYTLGSDYKLYRLGVDGRTIPKNTAVVIIATDATIQTYSIDGSNNLLVTDHAPGGNILNGSNDPVPVSSITTGTPHVLSVDANGAIGFRKYTGTEIPAQKAYYITTP